MKATVLYGPGDVRYETVDDPKIISPTDAIIKLSATCRIGRRHRHDDSMPVFCPTEQIDS